MLDRWLVLGGVAETALDAFGHLPQHVTSHALGLGPSRRHLGSCVWRPDVAGRYRYSSRGDREQRELLISRTPDTLTFLTRVCTSARGITVEMVLASEIYPD